MTYLTTGSLGVWPDILIWLHNNDTFAVSYLENDVSCEVGISSLISPFNKYINEVMQNIVGGIDGSFVICITDEAFKRIEEICEANRLLF